MPKPGEFNVDEFLASLQKEARGFGRAIRGLARDHLKEKGGWIEINGVRYYPGDIPDEH